MRKQKSRRQRNNEPEHRINERIRIAEIRLVGENVPEHYLGQVVDTDEAKKLASQLELDLVEINPKATPPICRIVNYTKFLYEEKKKKKEFEKKQKENNKDLKEMQFTPNIGQADLDVKSNKVRGFVEGGHNVKLMMKFRGREMQHNKEKGELVLLNIAKELIDIAKVDSLPKLNGRNMLMTISPKNKKGK